jgi:hypothetical protein
MGLLNILCARKSKASSEKILFEKSQSSSHKREHFGSFSLSAAPVLGVSVYARW